MTAKEIIAYGICALFWVPAVGLALHALYLLIKGDDGQANCSEFPNNWILCSKRLPDKEGDYLVTLLDDGRTWVEIALWNETFGGRWQAVLYNDVDYSDISNVIAWMPLPEPYPRGEQE